MIFASLASSAVSCIAFMVSFAGSSQVPRSANASDASEQQSQPGSDLLLAIQVCLFSHMIHIIADNRCKWIQTNDRFERLLWLGLVILGIILLAVGHLDQNWNLCCGQLFIFCTSSCAAWVYSRQNNSLYRVLT